MALVKGVRADYPFVIAEHRTPLCRESAKAADPIQRGKERNVSLAASKIDGIVIAPGQVFSYHHAVGRPSRLRGFRYGLELQNGQMSKGIGGGCCSVSNLLYLIALRSGLDVVERHRHKLDLFPDHGRTVPFGCGATVFFPTADLRIFNSGGGPALLHFRMEAGHLVGEVRSRTPSPHAVDVYEVDHRYSKEGEAWVRENRIRRKFINASGAVVRDEEVAHNVGRCLYDPELAQ
jgi:vancomycin resistance protein VanW